MQHGRAVALGGVTAGLVVLLPRMRRDFETRGSFSTATAAGMWTTYGMGGLLYAEALRRGAPAAPAPAAIAAAAAAGGLGLTAAGMGSFGSAAQVSGTEPGQLATGGVYRISRNPQYAGFVIAGLAGALARRSAPSAALTAAYGAICGWWVRVEERHLEREFGNEYVTFREKTPRWLGLPIS